MSLSGCKRVYLDQRLDSFARDKQAGDKQKNEKVASAVSAAVSSKVEKTVKNEVRNSVSSGMDFLVMYMPQFEDSFCRLL